MDVNSDRAFLRQFSAVIAGFMVLTVALIFLARYIEPEPEGDPNPSQAILAEQRITPMGAVRSGEAGAAELAEMAAAATVAPVEAAAADGAAVYGGLCMSCHDAGVAGAPIKGSELMQARLDEKGLDMLVQNAINGLNAMPARGGNPALSDDEIRLAVEFMLE
jgi:cytochrome c5